LKFDYLLDLKPNIAHCSR